MNEVHNKLEYNKVTPNIYIGTNMCCQTHFEEELLNEGINSDISLEEDRLDSPFGVDFYLWLPTKDQSPPSMDQIKLGVEIIKKLIDMNRKIYIHCKNGHGRAPTLVSAYFITQGMGIEEAINFIKEKRPSIHLHEDQIKALQEFKKVI